MMEGPWCRFRREARAREDIDTVLVDRLKALDPNRPIREADINEWQSISALPLQGSNVNLLRYCKGIIHIDAEIPDSALYLGVAEQKLHGSQIPGAAVDERRFSSAQ